MGPQPERHNLLIQSREEVLGGASCPVAADRDSSDSEFVVPVNAKAIGIFLVLIGHTMTSGQLAGQWIYAFHMPLFFFLSGFLMNPNRLAGSLASYAAMLFRRLVIPFLFYCLISYLIWILAALLGSRNGFTRAGWWRPILGIISANPDSLFFNVVLWFFPALASTSMLFFLLRKAVSAGAVLGVFLVSALLLVSLHQTGWPEMPWGIDIVWIAGFFHALGHWIRLRQALRERRFQRRAAVLTALLAFSGVLMVARQNGWVNLARLNFGSHPFLYLPGAILGIAGTLALARLIPPNEVMRWVAANTIVIFPLHLLFFGLLTGISRLLLHLPRGAQQHIWQLQVAYAAATILLCIPASILLRRAAPFAFGGRLSETPMQPALTFSRSH